MVAIDNPGSEMGDLMRRVRFLETQSGADGSGFGGGDSSHEGTGSDSIQLGEDAVASGHSSVAIGEDALANNLYAVALGPGARAGNGGAAVGNSAWATGNYSSALGETAEASGSHATALGWNSTASHTDSTAVGMLAVTTASNQVMLGTSSHTVVVPGTFSNPSARRLKQNIIPAPCLRSIFPAQYEWEYIADEKHRRRVGPIADELVGTDAERFLTFDDDGAVAGIDKLGLYGAQISALHQENDDLKARLTVLENLIEGLTNG
jgi:autotransporter adhesin